MRLTSPMHSHCSPLHGLVSLMSSRKDSFSLSTVGPYTVVSLNFMFVGKMETVMERDKSVPVTEFVEMKSL